MKYPLEFHESMKPGLEALRSQGSPPEGLLPEQIFRTMLAGMADQVKMSSNDEITIEDKYFTNSQGVDIQLRVYSPKKIGNKLPCFYWIHGGGTISGLPEQDEPVASSIAMAASCVVVSVNYRLAPENPYPAPLNDCYEGIEYVYNNPKLFNIDPDRIAVGGGSAGGLLSTSCAILAREKKGPKIIHQSLAYPMLDHRGMSESSKQITDVGIWDTKANLYGWDCYLSSVKNNLPKLAVPMLVEDLSNLPPAFLATGTIDCLRDETIEYAQKLAAAGVKTELHIYPGMVHIFDTIAPQAPATQDFNQARIHALKRAFGNA